MKISEDVLVDDLKKEPEFAETAVMFQGRLDGKPHDEAGKTLKDLENLGWGWKVPDMALGLEKLAKLSEDGRRHVFQVYSREEIAESPDKGTVRILVYPGDPKKPFVLITPGGAYVSVCSMVEGFPVAAEFNALGYPAVILNYRTSRDEVSPYFPTPLEDVAAALAFIQNHADEIGIQNLCYAMCGFSAGGSLTDTWGLASVGYGFYHAKKPDCIFANYSVSDLFALQQKRNRFLGIMFGKDYTEKDVAHYDVLSNMTPDYPPCFLTAAENDPLVPFSQSLSLEKRLKELGIPCEALFGKTEGHGYGIGGGTALAGWTRKAAAFWEGLRKAD